MCSLKTASAFLGRCFLLCVALQILVLVLFSTIHDWGYDMHARFFPTLTVEAFDQNAYVLLGQMKIAGMILFLIPWIAIKLVGKQDGEC